MFPFHNLYRSFKWSQPQNESHHCILPGADVMATIKPAIVSVLMSMWNSIRKWLLSWYKEGHCSCQKSKKTSEDLELYMSWKENQILSLKLEWPHTFIRKADFNGTSIQPAWTSARAFLYFSSWHPRKTTFIKEKPLSIWSTEMEAFTVN